MNHPSFLVALVFYFVWLGLIAYWLATRTAQVIKSVQRSKANYHRAETWVEASDPQALSAPERKKESHFSGQGI